MNAQIAAVVSATVMAVACTPSDKVELELTVRGHQELTGDLMPWLIGDSVTPGVCITPSLGTDTSRWRGRVFFMPEKSGGDDLSPAARSGATLCFEQEYALPERANELCLVITNDGEQELAASCLPIRATRHDPGYAALMQARGDIFTGSGANKVRRSLDLAASAEARGYRVTALRMNLIAAHFARRAGTLDEQQQVSERLGARPSWIDHRAAHSIGGQYFYEMTMRALLRDDLQLAWANSSEALQHFNAVADPRAIVAHTRRAQIIDRAGAPTEARQRLASAIEDCLARPCEPALLGDARNTLAWWLLQDPDADSQALAQAGALLQHNAEANDHLESANYLLNRAYLAVRNNTAPESLLERAEDLLQGLSGQRADELRQWSALIRGSDMAAKGDFDHALRLADVVANMPSTASLAARALSLRARALRASGRLADAARAWEAAIAQHRLGDTLNQWLPLSPGRRAQDYYMLALTAIDLDDPQSAWQWLERLDRESSDLCHDETRKGQAEDAAVTVMDRVEKTPASQQRRAQRARALAQLRRQHIDTARKRDDCLPANDVTSDIAWRAFAADDLIILLTRDASGRVVAARRTTMSRAQLLVQTTRLDQMLNDRTITDAAWRDAARALAVALTPPALESIGPVTRVALHGHLQRVPLAALPVGDGWLSQYTTLVTATGSGMPTATAVADMKSGPERGVFVVDPLGNLPSGRRAASYYSETFPAATVLHDSAATVAAVQGEMSQARWLHMDTHGEMDEAFVELFALRMADGVLPSRAVIANGAGLWLANLSGCLSGRWSLTADSGQWGLAGALARSGVRWVIGSRSQLDDAAAYDFNLAFYEHYQARPSVPAAYGQAIAALQREYPASIWAALLLLGGQSVATLTPSSTAQPAT